MIRNDSEHSKAVARIQAEKDRIEAMRKSLVAEGLKPNETKRALDPLISFHLQLVEEVEAYESLQRGEFGEFTNLKGIGRLLISLRIYQGLSQREFAAKIGVHESQVSRDERNEYHGITVGRVVMILDILGATVSSTVDVALPPDPGRIAV